MVMQKIRKIGASNLIKPLSWLWAGLFGIIGCEKKELQPPLLTDPSDANCCLTFGEPLIASSDCKGYGSCQVSASANYPAGHPLCNLAMPEGKIVAPFLAEVYLAQSGGSGVTVIRKYESCMVMTAPAGGCTLTAKAGVATSGVPANKFVVRVTCLPFWASGV